MKGKRMFVVVRKGTSELIWPNVYRTFTAAYTALEKRCMLDIAEVYQVIEISA
jgi:hypothetical protein